MKYCEKCNKYYSEDKRYCSECGCILINKDKSQNSSKAGNVHCDIENLEIPPYEHFLMQFLIPTVIGLSIAELIFTWQMLATGIPKILDGFWGSFVFYVVICAGLTKAKLLALTATYAIFPHNAKPHRLRQVHFIPHIRNLFIYSLHFSTIYIIFLWQTIKYSLLNLLPYTPNLYILIKFSMYS